MLNLKKLRKEKGLTQQFLAEKFGLSQQSIYKYEKNRAEPDIATLKELAEFFDTSVDYLVGASDIQEPYNGKFMEDLSIFEIEYLHFFRKMGSEDRLLMFQLSKSLTSKNYHEKP